MKFVLSFLTFLLPSIAMAACISPDNAVVGADPEYNSYDNLTSLTDSSGAVWTISGGVVQKNGSNAGSSSGATEVLKWKDTIYYSNGSQWFTWSGSAWGSGSTDPRWSASNTILPGPTDSGHRIIDNINHVWDVYTNRIFRDGQIVSDGSCVTQVIYYSNTVYRNTAANWWSWNNTTSAWDAIAGDPRTSTASPNNTVLAASDAMYGVNLLPLNGTMHDANNHSWTVNGSNQVVMDGVAQTNTSAVQKMLLWNGVVWQMNATPLWYPLAGVSGTTTTWTTPGQSNDPRLSADGFVLNGPTDANTLVSPANPTLGVWTLSGGALSLNGATSNAGSVTNVQTLLLYGGTVWRYDGTSWYSVASYSAPNVTWSTGQGTDPRTVVVPTGKILQPNKLYQGVNCHYNGSDGEGQYSISARPVANQIADIKDVFGTVPNSIYVRCFNGDTGAAALATATAPYLAAGLIPVILMFPYPSYPSLASETNAYTTGYNAVSSAVASIGANHPFAIEVANEQGSPNDGNRLAAQFNSCGNNLGANGPNPALWKTSCMTWYPIARGLVAGTVAALRDKCPNCAHLGFGSPVWNQYGFAIAMGADLKAYNGSGNSNRNLLWDATSVHWYNDAGAGDQHSGTDMHHFAYSTGVNGSGQVTTNFYNIMKQIGPPLAITEWGANDGTAANDATTAAAHQLAWITDAWNSRVPTATESGVAVTNFYELYRCGNNTTCHWGLYNPDYTTVPAEHDGLKNFIASHGNGN
jgi:hypothetical protein